MIEARGLRIETHSSSIGWGLEQDPWIHARENSERVRFPYPSLPERRPEEPQVLVVDYGRHPEPERLLLTRGTIVLVRPLGARLDDRLDQLHELLEHGPGYGLEQELVLAEGRVRAWVLFAAGE